MGIKITLLLSFPVFRILQLLGLALILRITVEKYTVASKITVFCGCLFHYSDHYSLHTVLEPVVGILVLNLLIFRKLYFT